MTPMTAFLLGFVVGVSVTAVLVAVGYAAVICSIDTSENES